MNNALRKKAEKSFGEGEVQSYAGITGDFNPIHLDKKFAEKTVFKERIVSGALPIGFIHSLYRELLGAEFRLLKQRAKFLGPVYFGEGIVFEAECKVKGKKFLCSSKARTKQGKTVIEENSEIMLKD